MRSRKAAYLLGSTLGLVAAGSPARASETVTYNYDALGRLVAAQHVGSVNNGQAQSLCYDAAGNRTQYRSSAAGTLADCSAPPPSPPPSPPPGNQPPVANANSLSAPKCVQRTINVTANDTDPEGNYPLVLTAVDQPWAWVQSSTTVGMTTPDTNGNYVITYTVADSLGASANGTLTVTVTGSQQCF